MKRDVKRERRILAMHGRGHSYAEIGRAVGLSKQRVHQLVEQAKTRPAPGHGGQK